MAEDKNNEEEKFDFTSEGEGYISLDEARVLAMRTAVETPGNYGSAYQGVTMFFGELEATETDDFYYVTLSFRPQGNFDGTPGQEQFVVGKEGTVAARQVLSTPIQTSASPAGTASKGGGFPILPVAIGLVVVGAIAAVGAILLMNSSGGDNVPIVSTISRADAVFATNTPAPIEPTYTPRPIPTRHSPARVIVVTPTPSPTAAPWHGVYYNQGNKYKDAENWVMAIGEYTKAIGVNPNYKNAYFFRGYSYEKIDQDQNAINDYNKAIQLGIWFQDPDDAWAYLNRGISYEKLGQYQNAINDYTKAIQLDLGYANAYNNRGNSYHGLGQYTAAINDYTEAIKIKPTARRHNNRGISYDNLGRYEEAIADSTKAIELDPGYAKAYNNRAFSYKKLEQYRLAIDDYTKAIQLDPGYANAYNNRGLVYRILSQSTLADADYAMACSLDSDWC